MRSVLPVLVVLGSSLFALPAAHAGREDRGDARVVRCESGDGEPRECRADTRRGVRLLRQLSRSPCIEGRTWGAMRDRIWVNEGCRADFAVVAGANYAQGDGRDVVRCDSDDGRWNHCSAPTRGRVELVQQLSRSPCIRGRSWGADDAGIWVSGGCRAEFAVSASRGRGAATEAFRCESKDGRSSHCPVDARGAVRLVRQISRAPCIEGRSWGQDRNGVWVDDGCRADFEVVGGWAGRRW